MTMLLEPWHRARGAHVTAGRVEHYGDPVGEHRAVTTTVAVVDASWRDRLVVTGDDRLEFVQGLCTNDVEALAEGHACELVFITPKGRMVADARCTKLDDALLLELEPGRGAALVEQLAKYRIHEAVDWQDAAEWLAALELWGPLAAQALGLERLEPEAGSAVVVGDVALIAVGTPFGAVCYVPADGVEAAAEALAQRAAALGGRPAGLAAVEPERLRLGLGRFGPDWDEGTNPLEAGLDRTLDYRKGCYVGQEVVAKATYIGQVSRRLVRLAWRGAAVAPGTALLGGRLPGRITSCAAVPGSDEVFALGVVRRDSAAAGTPLQVGEGGPQALVTGYPYRSAEKPV